MRPNIHPKYGPLELFCTNGTSFITGSTKPGQMKLGIDLYNHWAWNKEKKITESDEGTVAKFNSKLGSDFFNKDVLK